MESVFSPATYCLTKCSKRPKVPSERCGRISSIAAVNHYRGCGSATSLIPADRMRNTLDCITADVQEVQISLRLLGDGCSFPTCLVNLDPEQPSSPSGSSSASKSAAEGRQFPSKPLRESQSRLLASTPSWSESEGAGNKDKKGKATDTDFCKNFLCTPLTLPHFVTLQPKISINCACNPVMTIENEA
ncbi:hypothetical protein CCH79_00005828 [Gambusia affinis]|uniref:Uncharacterized protein n=1 Tax=Gambusia affinis TaxID=33528 RepID=A0A315VKF8_GAMAF|nr:hypothetical protein CCH79_00005828 [Gambusia affinis]